MKQKQPLMVFSVCPQSRLLCGQTLFISLYCVFLGASCAPLDYDLKAFLEKQTGTISLGEAAPADGVVMGTDGYVCLKAGTPGFSLMVDNPLAYDLRVEGSFTQTLGAGISDVTVSQQGIGSLAVSIPSGTVAGNEGALHIKVKTAKEGRLLYEGDINISFLKDFDARLTGLSLPSGLDLNPPFDPDTEDYQIDGIPASFALSVLAANSGALVTIDGITGIGGLNNRIITPLGGPSTVLIRVELPHGAACQDYTIRVNRENSADGYLVIAKAPDARVYQVQGDLNTEGMQIFAVTGSGTDEIAPDQCVMDYDFTAPGTKTVTVSYNGLSTDFEAWVLGLTGLSVSGPAGYRPDLSFDPSSAADYNRDLETVPATTGALDITAESALANVAGAGLRITNTVNNDPIEYAAENGAATSVRLITNNPSPPLNTIEIEVSLYNVSRTYTIMVFRDALTSGTELFVSPEGSDGGNGSEEHPFATVKKALDIVKYSGLEHIPGSSVTITLSGTIAGPGTDNGMVEIAGQGYPEIILRGKGPGPEAGVLDAGNANRVLYISNYNSGDYSTGNNKVTLGDNLTITGGSHPGYGGGVYVQGGTFTMTGGTIRGNTVPGNANGPSYGGGVCVENGTFTMSGGTIQENTVFGFGYGGGVCVQGGTFTMTGGTIKNNEGGGWGGGVYVYNSAFTMSGGIIQQNTITAEINSYGGGGVLVYYSTFIMDGGTIENNDGFFRGGGVLVYGGNFIMNEGAAIRGNVAAQEGGGVYVSDGILTINGGTIQENTSSANNSSGGGVYISYGTLTMTGGTIQGNVVSNGNPYQGGGGVYISTGTFTKRGGIITGNDASLPDLPNIASTGNGHAAFAGGKKRNATAGEGLDLYAAYDNNTYTWTYNDTSPDGVGDTTANWDPE
jgi:hypothetical protein